MPCCPAFQRRRSDGHFYPTEAVDDMRKASAISRKFLLTKGTAGRRMKASTFMIIDDETASFSKLGKALALPSFLVFCVASSLARVAPAPAMTFDISLSRAGAG
ncbi:hypothetical protein OIU74_028522 [Salix koriyanagi]|uniref:Uncharacterized protein n=1 Tax=Salix koriyanagi TaxID=2511006 RepID=A0A9Q0VC79_9ROSI|nr:hypothetical protein OIU74_028522 [Salix koriyanagi]